MEDFEVYHEKDRLRFEIRDITTAQVDNPGNHDQKPTSVQQPSQLLVKFVHNFHYKFTNTAIDGTETTIREYDRIKERSCGFDIDKLKDYKYSFGIFTSMLSLIGVRIGRAVIVKLIINDGLKIHSKDCYRGRQVLGLHVYVRSEYLRVRCDFCTVGRGTRMMEARLAQLTNDDNSNKGMVPASYPAINKVLKRVRVDSTSADDGESPSHDDVEEEGREGKRRKIRVSESESCTVCMEQFKGGSTVVCMPCFHVFHGRCIVKWLRKSHYCPVCRFQVPTDSNQKEVPTDSEQKNEVPTD